MRGWDAPARPREHGRRGRPGGVRCVALLASLALGLVSCVPGGDGPASFPSPVDGIVVAVSATGLTEVQGFTLRPTSGGANLVFSLGPLENATQFAPGHLKEHEATGTPVRVYFVSGADGKLVVYRLEDAPVPPSTGTVPPSSSPSIGRAERDRSAARIAAPRRSWRSSQ